MFVVFRKQMLFLDCVQVDGVSLVHWCSACLSASPPSPQSLPFPKCPQSILLHPPIHKCWLHYLGADAIGRQINYWQLHISLKALTIRKSYFVSMLAFRSCLPGWCILILDFLDGWECIATHWISWFVEVHTYIGLAPEKWEFLVVRVRASFCRVSPCSLMFSLPECLPPPLPNVPIFPKTGNPSCTALHP